MNPSTEAERGADQIRRANNRRIGIILAMLASAVFVSVIFRQWVTGSI